MLVNGKRPGRISDVAITAPVVAFLPDDLDVVKRGPALRREYLDDLGAQLDANCWCRSARVREGVAAAKLAATPRRKKRRSMTLDVWDVRLAEAGGRVLANRLRLLGRVMLIA